MKNLYIVDHFCPFPTSEYGGIWNVIAENDEECYDLIVEADQEFNVDYYSNLRDRILNARVFALAEEVESQVVESFTT
ncbi:MAG: hypothetical protein ACO3CQ_02560 [Candidatus Nanopelagicaceae bacterium]|jgi:hypothetical protein